MPPTFPTDPGTIAVPMSTILDALKDVLDKDERAKLFDQILGLRPQSVRPGDLITAEQFNQILSDVNDLLQRVAILEAGTDTTAKKPVIHAILPKIVRTGDEVTVQGENLTPKLLSGVQVEEVSIDLQDLSSKSGPTLLVFKAPAVSLPSSGATVVLRVDNPAGFAQETYFQLPAVAENIKADVAFALTGVTPKEPIQPNKTYDYKFEIEIHSSHDESFVLTPKISGTGWTAVVDGSAKIDVTSASAGPGIKVTKTIKVTTGASGTGSLDLSLKGTKFPAFAASAQPTPVKIDQQQPIPDSGMKVHSVSAAPTVDRLIVDTTLLVKAAQGATPGLTLLTVLTQFPTSGKYKIEGLAVTPPGEWNVERNISAQSDPLITTTQVDEKVPVVLKITGVKPNPAKAQLSYTASSLDGSKKLPFTFGISAVTSLPA